MMNGKRLFLGLLTATVVIAPLADLKPTSARSITIANPKVDDVRLAQNVPVEIPFDPLEVGKAIADAVASAQNREGFLQGLKEQAIQEGINRGGGYNVMVFNLSQPYDATGIRNTQKFFQQFDYDGIPYGVWIFKAGTFINNGDGGFINWAFEGRFTRTGDQGHTVIFE